MNRGAGAAAGPAGTQGGKVMTACRRRTCLLPTSRRIHYSNCYKPQRRDVQEEEEEEEAERRKRWM